jgi:hypothetical protein
MDDRSKKPARWEWVPVNVAMPLSEATANHSSGTSTFALTDEAGEPVGEAIGIVDARRRLVTIRELRYDATKVSEAGARDALARFLPPAVEEVAAEVPNASEVA